jgi:ribosome hibernation promoting factor
MRFDIHSKQIDVDKPLLAHIEHRLRFAIGRFEPLIRRVRVELSHSNGASRAAVERCRIRVDLSPTGDVEIDDSDSDLYALTKRAAGRVGLAVFSELYRLRETKRRSVGTD